MRSKDVAKRFVRVFDENNARPDKIRAEITDGVYPDIHIIIDGNVWTRIIPPEYMRMNSIMIIDVAFYAERTLDLLEMNTK